MFLYGTKYIFRQKRTAIERKIGSKVECLKNIRMYIRNIIKIIHYMLYHWISV